MTNRFAKLDGYNPQHNVVAGECPHCLRHSTLTVSSHSKLSGSYREDTKIARCLMTLDCNWCAKESVYLRFVSIRATPVSGGTREYYTTIDIEQVWPGRTPRELAPEAPETVREVFAEAALAEAAGAFRLAGIGYRATVEQIVKERGAVGKNLYERITGLKSLGATEEIVEAFHEARFVGNDAAHDALAYSTEEIADIAELINEAVLVLYVQPAQRAKMAAQRAARRTAAKQSSP
ncbi:MULTISPECIES: DUF4145 domain-containing protein [unclassified Streptomyces]|uniref:DUF4145 domain-containing protein n=1 Tax=unclassified Streptomyces TaxID=2593676 RepID=UPI0029A4F354|nr:MULTISPECIES: DUF4145 domain-containing protein [unclassified Streptomyces]MDX3772262.1 DUF4145 domain-containing protein [Streptomyces sp. AK08-01B]MDX3816691.1 DUF4145 domain-containing protein [Streptomyces sp. AK08-01A]